MNPIGKTVWAIAEGYIPESSTAPEPEMRSHEALCLLNTSDRDARVRITFYFSDREPARPCSVEVGVRRTSHLRVSELADPEPVPRATDNASVVVSDVPIVVQHTRLDSRRAANALVSTIGYAEH